jgi:hypothetical protein
MSTKTQGIQQGEWLLSEPQGSIARDVVIVTISGGVALPSGTVLGKITATGKHIKYDNAASDGSQTAVGILWNPLPGVNGDVKATMFNRDCEVIESQLNGGAGLDAAGEADLAALGFKLR